MVGARVPSYQRAGNQVMPQNVVSVVYEQSAVTRPARASQASAAQDHRIEKLP